MAAGKISIQANDGKVAGVVFEDGASSNVTVTVPKEGGKVIVANGSGNVGIGGTPASGFKQEIFGPSIASPATTSNRLSLRELGNVSALNFVSANEGGTLVERIWSSTALSLGSNATERVRVNTAGNVGIGVAPSAWSSSFKAIDIGYAGFYQYNNNYVGMSQNQYYDGSKYAYKANGRAYDFTAGSIDGFIWRVAPDGIAGNAITWDTIMNLGTNGVLNAKTLTTGYMQGTYTGPSSVVCYSGSGNDYTAILGRNVVSTDSVFSATIGGIVKAAIAANGSFLSATNSYGSTSDVKLKENIVDTSPKLDKLMQVQVRNFNYIGSDQKQIGVVAQEIEQIFPSIIFETNDTKQVEVKKVRQVIDKEAVLSEDGAVLEEATYKDEEYTEFETVETGETTKNVKYSVIYMMMLKAMQEQQEIINDLKARVEVLEVK